MAAKLTELDAEKEELDAMKRSQLEVLERISGLTTEEAKRYLIDQLADAVTHEQAVKLKELSLHRSLISVRQAKRFIYWTNLL